MPIKLVCVCTKELSLPDQLAGKKIKCKHCGKVLKVPDKAEFEGEVGQQKYEENSPFFIAGMQYCPSCGRSYPAATVVCVPCGVNIKSGATLYTSVDDPSSISPAESGDQNNPSITQRLFRRFLGKQ